MGGIRRKLKYGGALVAVVALVASVAAASSADDGSASDQSSVDPETAAVVADRAGVIDDIVNAAYIGETGRFSDGDELAPILNELSDSWLAEALRASNVDELDSVITGGATIPTGATTAALGDSDSDLVFTAITPCRVFNSGLDIRGPMSAGEIRNFAVQSNTGAVLSDQGGDASGCPDIPFDPAAVVLTLSAASATGTGFATVWEFGGPQPAAVTLGFRSGQFLANTTTTPVCISCGSQQDVNVAVAFQAAQVSGDIVGYFNPPEGCAPGTIELGGNCVESSLRAAESYFVAGDTCEANGGRLPSMGEATQARDVLGDAGVNEHTSNVFHDGTSFRNMRLTGTQGLVVQTTLVADQFRCVLDPFNL